MIAGYTAQNNAIYLASCNSGDNISRDGLFHGGFMVFFRGFLDTTLTSFD